MQVLISLVLCLTMIFSIGGNRLFGRTPNDKIPLYETREEESTEVSSKRTTSSVVIEPGSDRAEIPEYTRCDREAFMAGCDSLSELAAQTDSAAVIALYDELYEQYVTIDTLSCVAYFYYSDDVTDEYWSEEYIWSENLHNESKDAINAACRAVMDGPCAEEFRAHVGDEAADFFAAYEPYSEETTELMGRQQELVNEYFEELDAVGETEIVYNGETWTKEKLVGMEGKKLRIRDYDGYCAVYEALEQAKNEILGSIYVELVQLRSRIAELEGYESYSDFAYEQKFCRDFDTEDAARFCQEVQDCISQEYYDRIFYSSLSSGDTEAVMDEAELVAALGEYAALVNPVVRQAWEYMEDNGLYNLGDESVRVESCYTNTFIGTETPVIFMRLYGGSRDYGTLCHEFGHFVDAWCNPIPNAHAKGGCYDLLEIHSNGLEVLYTAFYDDLFGEGAESAEFATLSEQLSCVVDGCIMDEFQRRVYEAGADITLDEVNAIYAQVCESFGEGAYPGSEYYWMYVPHNFESPLYYISYAVSSLAALQIWNTSCEDYGAAVDQWLAVVEKTAYNTGYCQVMDECDMLCFTEEGVTETICRPVLDYLESIEE